MIITVTQEGYLKFSEVFNPIIFENERGERISVCQSDGGFEVIVVDEMQRAPPQRLLHIVETACAEPTVHKESG